MYDPTLSEEERSHITEAYARARMFLLDNGFRYDEDGVFEDDRGLGLRVSVIEGTDVVQACFGEVGALRRDARTAVEAVCKYRARKLREQACVLDNFVARLKG